MLKHLEHAVSNLDKARAGLGDDADLRGIGMQLQTYSAAITECRTALASSLRAARTHRQSKAAYGTNGAQGYALHCSLDTVGVVHFTVTDTCCSVCFDGRDVATSRDSSSSGKPKPKKKPGQKTGQIRKPKSGPEPKSEQPQPDPDSAPEPEPEPESRPNVGRTPRKTPRKALPMTPLFSPALQSPIAPTRDAYMEHLGTRLRTIGLDKIPSLADLSPGLDESGTDTRRAQVWTELWALHRENKDVESKDTSGSKCNGST